MDALDRSPAGALGAAARIWAEDRLNAVRVIFAGLQVWREWPEINKLQIEVDAENPAPHWRVAPEGPPDLWQFLTDVMHARFLGVAEQTPGSTRVALRLRTWSLLPEATQYAAAVVDFVATSARRYTQRQTTVNASDVKHLPAKYGVDWDILMTLVEAEGFYLLTDNGESLKQEEWTRPLNIPTIRNYIRVRTVDDYLKAEAQLRIQTIPPGLRPYYLDEEDQHEAEATEPPQTAITTGATIPAQPSTIQHYYHINDQSGQIYINSQVSTTIQTSVAAIDQAGLKELAEAIRKLTDTVISSPEFDDDQRSDISGQIETIASEASKPAAERRPSRIRAAMASITALAEGATAFLELWHQITPVLQQVIGR